MSKYISVEAHLFGVFLEVERALRKERLRIARQLAKRGLEVKEIARIVKLEENIVEKEIRNSVVREK